MIAESYKSILVVSAEKSESEQVMAALFDEAARPSRASLEYVRLHPALTEQSKIVDQARYSADEKNDYFAMFSTGEEQLNKLFSSLHERYKSCAAHGVLPLAWHKVSSKLEAAEETRLMDNRVYLKLAISPATKGDGWTFSFVGSVPLQIVPLLHRGLAVCCALGKDGCSPLADLAVRVTSFEMESSEAFAFRQQAAVYRAVRRCFLRSLVTD